MTAESNLSAVTPPDQLGLMPCWVLEKRAGGDARVDIVTARLAAPAEAAGGGDDVSVRRLVAELVGTAGLLLAVVGSGITASGDGAASAQLFQHAIVVGAALGALIVTFGPVSGAHFNPAVTLVDTLLGGMGVRMAAGYVAAQVTGAFLGVVTANLLFGVPAVALAGTDRTGSALYASEAVATAGLLLVIFGVVRSGRVGAVPAAIGAWIAAAVYSTSSTSFANPAVTLARTVTDTYTGIAPPAVPGFLLAQTVGALAAWTLVRWLFRPSREMAAQVVVPHTDSRALKDAPASTKTTR